MNTDNIRDLINGETAEDCLDRLLGWYEREVSRQYDSRLERAKDADFFDGEQFDAKTKAELEARGQSALVFNDIKPAILWILGNERRNRNEWDVKPRSEDDVQPALTKAKLIKYIDDINNARFERSEAFAAATKTGEGWTQVYIANDEWGDPEIRFRHVDWREVLADSSGIRQDCQDVGFIFRTKIVPLNELLLHFPDYEDDLTNQSVDEEQLVSEHRESAYSADADFGGSLSLHKFSWLNGRRAVRVIECWYRNHERVDVLRDGPLDRTVFDKDDPEHQVALQSGQSYLAKVNRRQMYCAIFTQDTLLWHSRSPYRHNDFPYVRRTVFRDDRSKNPYGLIRDLRDPQEDLNHRRNKALFLASTRRVVMDEGAVDIKKLEDEVSRPDAIIEKRVGAGFEIIENLSMASSQLDMANQDSAYIRQISGVTGENQGLPTNATSGVAIQARAEQGTIITTMVFDNSSAAHQKEGELVLSLIEQFMTQQQQIRITGERGKDEFLQINDGRPETDITATKADFVISERKYQATLRQALSEQLIQSAGQIASLSPQAGLAALEMALELSDLPNGMEMAKRIREASGIPDPHDPESAKAMQEQQAQQAQLQQQQMQLELQGKQAEIAEKKARAEAAKAQAEHVEAQAIERKTAAIGQAIATAQLVEANPHLAQTADDLLQNMDQILNTETDEGRSQGESDE